MRLHVAIQPLPALHAFAGSRLASERALETIAVGLRTSNSHTLTISSSVLVSDADAKVVHSDLLEGVDAMVWVAMGMGWEAPTGALSTSDLVKSIRKLSQPPRILAIALQYGSQSCAEALRSAGVQTVVWLQCVRTVSLAPALVLRALIPAISALVSGLPYDIAAAVTEAARSVCGASCSPTAGILSDEHVAPPPASGLAQPIQAATTTVQTKCRGAVGLSSLIDGFMRDVRDEALALLSVDLGALEDLLEHLHAPAPPALLLLVEDAGAVEAAAADSRGKASAEGLKGASTAPMTDVITDVVACAAARIRAIALEVCSSVAGQYHVVRITSRADLPALQTMVYVEGMRTLAWFDLDEEGQCDEELLFGALRPLLSAAVHVLLTSYAASAAQLRALAAALAPAPTAAATSFVQVSLAPLTPGAVRADALHEELRLTTTIEPSQRPAALLEVFDAHALRGAIARALPGGGLQRPVALFADGPDGLVVRLCLSDVAFVHALRDEMLSGDFEAALNHQLAALPRGHRVFLEGCASLASDAADRPRQAPQALGSGFLTRLTARGRSATSHERAGSVVKISRHLVLHSDGFEWFEDGAASVPIGFLSVTALTTYERINSIRGSRLTVMTTSGSAGAARLVLEGGTADGDDRMAPSLDAWQSALEALLAEKRAVKAASSAAVAKTSVATTSFDTTSGATTSVGTATTVTSAGGGAAAAAGVSPNGTVYGALRVTADKGHFAAVYEASLLMLEQLTPHQRTVLAAVSTARHVLLEAPAGGGKTFVAMARILEVLLRASGTAHDGAHDDEPSFAVEKTAKVLFTCWSAPLCLFVCRWICKRVRDDVQRERALSRLFLLHDPMDEGPRAVALDVSGTRLVTRPAVGAGPFELLVVDESHHVYSRPELRERVESFVTPGWTRRLLLADISQSLGRSIPFPTEVERVQLTEVVRCSRRIVAGAMAFQLGGEQKLLTRCHHSAVGPPLKSFLFDHDPEAFGTLAAGYAHHVCEALSFLRRTYSGLPLHDRLALLCASGAFVARLRPELTDCLARTLPDWQVALVSAADASAHVGSSVDGSGLPADGIERIVLDSIDQFDGLERLIVIGIGLDHPISDASCAGEGPRPTEVAEGVGDAAEGVGEGAEGVGEAGASPDRHTRSLLYRAVTRAHMQVIVVNELISGGWLEFLGSVRLREDELFDAKRALERCETTAVEEIVSNEIETALRAQALQGHLLLDAAATTLLRDAVARAVEGGVLLDLAVQETLRAWRSDLNQVAIAIQRAAELLCYDLTPNFASAGGTAARGTSQGSQSLLDELTLSVAASLRRGEASSLEQAAEGAVKAHMERRRQGRTDAALQAAAAAVAVQLPTGEMISLREIVGAALQRGETLEAAATAAVSVWQDVDAVLRDAFSAEAARCGMQLSEEAEYRLLEEVRTERRRGETVGAAVSSALSKKRRELMTERISAAVDTAVAKGVEYVRNGGTTTSMLSWSGWGSVLSSAITWTEAMTTAEAKAAIIATACPRFIAPDDFSGATFPFSRLAPFFKAWGELHAAATQVLQVEATTRNLELGVGGLASLESVATTITLQRWQQVLHNTTVALGALMQETAPAQGAAVAAPIGTAPAATVGGDANAFGVADAPDGGAEGEDPPTGTLGEPSLTVPIGSVLYVHVPTLTALAREALLELERDVILKGERAARIGAALERAAKNERLVLTDAAAAVLERRIAAALQRGEEVEAAAVAAVASYHRQLVRRQVQQSTWDPSSNSSRKVSGVLKFMPFKHKDSEFLEYDLLCQVFRYLPLQSLGTLAQVSKRWRSVATDPSWKPELLALAWGAEGFPGHDEGCKRPTALPFASEHPIVQIACADAATIALTAVGQVWHWGQHWLRTQGIVGVPTRLDELRDVQSIAATVPGYFHGRRHSVGFHCAAVTRSGHLYTWGPNLSGQLLRRTTPQQEAERPAIVERFGGASEKVLLVTCGLRFTAVHCQPSVTEASRGDESTQRHNVESMSLRELKALIAEARLSTHDCIDKRDLVARAKTAAEELAGGPTGAASGSTQCQMYTQGRFCREGAHRLRAWSTLSGVPLRQLVAGGFHCCALTTTGDVYTFGHQFGDDHANGNLLGHGPVDLPSNQPVALDEHEPISGMEEGVATYSPMSGVRMPRRLLSPSLGAVAEISCSTYSTLAITVDGRAFTWGDCDGDSLGHSIEMCHAPCRVSGLAGLRVAHGAVCYTNGAVALNDGSVFVWGGKMWEGGMGGGQVGPARVSWGGGVPPCYRCTSVVLGHLHGYLIFRKEP